MKEAGQAVAVRHLFQRLHDHLVVIYRQIDLGIDRSQLVLGRSHFVVLGLCSNPQLPQLVVYFVHKGSDPLADRSVIVIRQFLAFGRHSTKQGPACVDQVFSL